MAPWWTPGPPGPRGPPPAARGLLLPGDAGQVSVVVPWGPGNVGLTLAGLGSGPGPRGENSVTTSLGLSSIIYRMRGLNQNLFGGSAHLDMGAPWMFVEVISQQETGDEETRPETRGRGPAGQRAAAGVLSGETVAVGPDPRAETVLKDAPRPSCPKNKWEGAGEG